MSRQSELEKAKKVYRDQVRRKLTGSSNMALGGADPPPATMTGLFTPRKEAVKRFLQESVKEHPDWAQFESELEQEFDKYFPNGFPFPF
jgi:hypothetical protein